MARTPPASRAAQAAAKTVETGSHLKAHQKHRDRHEAISLAGGALLGGEVSQHASPLVKRTIEDYGTRLPLTPKEAAAVESLIADHDVAPSLTRRDPGETGPVLAYFGQDTYLIESDVVTKLVS